MTYLHTEPIHIAGAIIFPFIGLMLGLQARRSLGPAPRSADILWCLSLMCGCIGLTFWPHAMTTLLDSVAHIRGLAHIVSDALITAGFVLQFAFVSTVEGRWTRARWSAIALYVVLLGAYAAQWATLHDTYSFYGHYAGRPPALLAANLTLVTLIVGAATLAIAGYAGCLRRGAHNSDRLMAMGVTFVSGLTVVYGLLVLGQVVVSALGYGSTQVAAVTAPIMIVASTAGLAIVWLLTGRRSRRLRAYLQVTVSLHAREAELDERERRLAARETYLDEREGNLADLAAFVEDQLIQVHPDIDERPVDDMETWCAAAGLDTHRTRVTLLTTRLTLLTEAGALKLPRYDLGLLPDDPDEDDRADADLARGIEDHEELLSDVMRLLQLVTPRPLPKGIEQRVEPPGWRRDAAEAILTTLRRHGRRRRFA